MKQMYKTISNFSISCTALICPWVVANANQNINSDKIKLAVFYPTETQNNQNRAKELRCMTRGVFEEYKKKGINFEYKFAPYEQHLSAAANAIKVVSQERADLVLGTIFSKEAIFVGTELKKIKIPFVAPIASNPEVTANNEYAFMTAFSDRKQAMHLALFADNRLNSKKIAIIKNISDPYSSFLSDEFQKTFEQLKNSNASIHVFNIISGTNDYDIIAKKIVVEKMDTVFVPLYHPQLVPIYKSLVQARYKGTILGSDSTGGYQLYRDMLGGLSPDMPFYFSGQWSMVVKGPRANKFEYLRRHYCDSAAPVMQMAAAFDSAELVVSAINTFFKQKFKYASLRDILEKTKFQGLIGPIAYSKESHESQHPVYMFKLTDQDPILLGQADEKR